MPPWVCECSCVCGLCPGGDCECECHMLDPLTNAQLMQLMVSKGGFFVADVANKSRNMLFKMMTQHEDPEKLLKDGVKMVHESMRKATSISTPVSVLRSIAVGTRTPSPTSRSTTVSPVSKSIKKKASAPARKQPQKKQATAPKKRAARKKTAAQKAKARRLDNCQT